MLNVIKHKSKDLTQCRIGAVCLDACINHGHKIDKIFFFRRLSDFLILIVDKSV
jgi:hypothetical protein